MKDALLNDAEILYRIEAFCEQHALGVTTFGRLAIGDPNLVGNLRKGRSLTLRTVSVLSRFMVEYQPSQQADAA